MAAPTKFTKIIQTSNHLLFLILFFAFPVFLLPNTSNFFEPNKLLLASLVLGISLVGWSLQIISTRKLKLTLTPFTLPIISLLIITLISTYLNRTQGAEAMASRSALYIILSLLFLVATNTIRSVKFSTQALIALISSGTLLGLIAIFQSLGFGVSNLLNRVAGTNIPNTLAFTPTGSPLALISFLFVMVIIAFYMALKSKEVVEKVALALCGAVMVSALFLSTIYSFPGKDTAPLILPHQYGYRIAIKSLESVKTALIGYGPNQYISAFTQSRPVSLNQTELWNIRFNSGSTEVFTILTTLGLAGLIGWFWLLVNIVRHKDARNQDNSQTVVKYIIALPLLIQLLIPGSFVLIFLGFALVIIWAVQLIVADDASAHTFNLHLPENHHPDSAVAEALDKYHLNQLSFFLALIPAIIFTGTAVYLLYQTTQSYAAEITFKKSLDAAAKNEAVSTYDLQRQAILQDPVIARYRRAYAATNMALANSLANKEDLNDQDKQNISQLIQQAIREAKAAVALDPKNPANWETLSNTYRQLIGVAKGADQWAVASYAQAITVDPTNPQLRLQLGGIYYQLQQYDQAIRLFQQATELKPDWANAYYNLSNAYLQKKDNVQAFLALRQTVRLLDPSSADYAKAKGELEKLQAEVEAQLPKTEPDGTEQPVTDTTVPEPQGDLSLPEPTPTPNPQVQVNLPTESGPDDLAPTTTPEATGSATNQ